MFSNNEFIHFNGCSFGDLKELKNFKANCFKPLLACEVPQVGPDRFSSFFVDRSQSDKQSISYRNHIESLNIFLKFSHLILLYLLGVMSIYGPDRFISFDVCCAQRDTQTDK